MQWSDSLEPLVMLVKILPEISGVFKHPKYPPLVIALHHPLIATFPHATEKYDL